MTQSDSLSLSAAQPTATGIIGRISVRFGGTKAKELERFLKFMVVGAIGALIDLGLTNILLSFKVPIQIATGIGFVVAVISNFIWNRSWTYPESRERAIAPQITQFFIVNALGLLIREIVVTVLDDPFRFLVKTVVSSATADAVDRLGGNMAIMVALVIVMLWNFFVNRYWTYRDVK